MALSWGLGASVGLAVGQVGWIAGICAAAAAGASMLARGSVVRLACLLLAAALFGVLRGGVAHGDSSADQLAPHLGRVTLTGKVLDAPTVQGGRAAFSIEVFNVASSLSPGDGATLASPAKVAVRWAPDVARAGDVVRVSGRLAEPRSRPGLPLADLLARRGIHYVLAASSVRVVDRPEAGPLGLIRQARERLEASIRGALPEPHASLTAGVVLGARASLPPQLREALSVTGTSHIVAVSGFNVAIAAAAVHLIAVRLVGRPWSALPSVIAIWTYVLLVGAPASAVRAGLMASLALVATSVGRLPDAITTLAVAAAAMLFWDAWLLFDLGFQLSVLATAGLILFAAPLGDRLSALPRLVRESIAVALATHVVTLPLVLLTFHTLSVVAPLSNLLVGLTVPWLMLLGALLSVLGPLPGLGDLLAWCTWLLASATLGAIDWTAALPWSVVYTGRLPFWLAIAWYAALVLWAVAGSPDVRALAGRRLVPVAAFAGVTLAFVPAAVAVAAGSSGPARVSILDTPGSAAFARTADGRTVLISAATSDRGLISSVAQRLEFWERTIDVAMLTAGARPSQQALDETLRRYAARIAVRLSETDADSSFALMDGSSPDMPAHIEKGQILEIGGDFAVTIVDVRDHDGQPVLDLSVELAGGSVWLPGPGQPSIRWRDHVVPDRPIVVRLPAGSETWPRDLAAFVPEADLRAIIAEGLSERAAGRLEVLTFEHRRGGAIEIASDASALVVRPERCGGAECSYVLD